MVKVCERANVCRTYGKSTFEKFREIQFCRIEFQLRNWRTNQMIQNAANFEFGAVQRRVKLDQSCRPWILLQNQRSIGKFGIDTAENEPEYGYGISLLFVSLIFGPGTRSTRSTTPPGPELPPAGEPLPRCDGYLQRGRKGTLVERFDI